MRYKAEYLGNKEYRLENNGEILGVIGEEKICKLIEAGEFIEGVCEIVNDTYNIKEGYDDKVIALYLKYGNNNRVNVYLYKRMSKLYIIGDKENNINTYIDICNIDKLISKNCTVLVSRSSKCIINNIECADTYMYIRGETKLCTVIATGNCEINIEETSTAINSIVMDGEEIKFDIDKAKFKKAILKANIAIIACDTKDDYDGKIYMDVQEVKLGNLCTNYKIYSKQCKLDLSKYYKNDNETTVLDACISSFQLNIKKNLRLKSNGRIIIGSREDVEISKLYYGSTIGGFVGYKGSKLYIKNEIKDECNNQRGLVLELLQFVENGTIYTDYGTDAYRFLATNNIKFEIRGGNIEKLIAREAKEGMIGVNSYKKISDVMSLSSLLEDEVIAFNINTDWKYGYLEDNIGITSRIKTDYFNGRLPRYIIETLRVIGMLPDIKYEIYDKLLNRDIKIDLCRSIGYGVIIVDAWISYKCNDNNTKTERIALTIVGKSIVHAAYLTGVQVYYSGGDPDAQKVLDMFKDVTHIDIEAGKIFIDNLITDKSDRDIMHNFLSRLLIKDACYITDSINNLVIFSCGNDIIAYKSNRKIYAYNKGRYASIDREDKLTRINYTIEDLHKTIRDEYNSSRLRKILA